MSIDPVKLNSSIDTHINAFKDQLITQLHCSHNNTDIVTFIRNYEFPKLNQDDYIKRRRVKNTIPFHEKCLARRGDGEQCSRRKRKDSDFCGTHSKACPHGIINIVHSPNQNAQDKNIVKKQIEVWLEDIGGIMYWINDSGTVYHPDDIRNNVENPRVISHYEKNEIDGEDVYKIIGEIH